MPPPPTTTSQECSQPRLTYTVTRRLSVGSRCPPPAAPPQFQCTPRRWPRQPSAGAASAPRSSARAAGASAAAASASGSLCFGLAAAPVGASPRSCSEIIIVIKTTWTNLRQRPRRQPLPVAPTVAVPASATLAPAAGRILASHNTTITRTRRAAALCTRRRMAAESPPTTHPPPAVAVVALAAAEGAPTAPAVNHRRRTPLPLRCTPALAPSTPPFLRRRTRATTRRSWGAAGSYLAVAVGASRPLRPHPRRSPQPHRRLISSSEAAEASTAEEEEGASPSPHSHRPAERWRPTPLPQRLLPAPRPRAVP